MEIRYNVTGDRRKALVKVISDTTGARAVYKYMPTCNYEIDYFTVTKDGTLLFDDRADTEEVEKVLEAIAAAGFDCEPADGAEEAAEETEQDATAAEAEGPAQEAEEAATEPDSADETGLTVSLPLDGFNPDSLDRLQKLTDSKAALIRKALGADRLTIQASDGTVRFPWWDTLPGPEETMAFTAFIAALCKMAKESKRVTATEKDVESEKYAFRGFLLRLGFIGADSNGYRQFNTAYIEIPKKQGKSELAAAVALLLLCGDGEERAEVYGCAADRNQAKIVFDVAVDMVRFSPALSKRVKILESQKKITYLPTNSSYQVLSADVANKHGFNTHGVIFDELHTQPNRKLFDVMLQGSGDARMQPLYFLITTAGNDTNSICYEVHQKALDIQAGRKIDPTFYSVIYGAAEDEDWTDPKVWKKANPSLGITVGIDKVKAACESAKQNPGEENSFRQLRLNQWVKQSVRWMPMDKWDACAFPVSEDDLEGRVCYGGLDLSSTTDITAFVLVFPPLEEDGKYCVLPYFWVPEDTLDLRVRRDHVPYDVWERQGAVMTTEGNVIHYGYIEKFIEGLGERFNIREIAFDRWGAVQMVQNLEGMGFTVVPFGQGFKDMSPPTKELMKLVLEKRVAHGGHPVLRWMMDNIFIRTDPAGNIQADKEKSTEKIDGAVATIMALDRAIRCGLDTGESVYDTRGLLSF